MQSEVTRAHVVVSAVLDERMGDLGEVAQFKVGHVLELNATAHGRVRLECNGERLMWCHLGKSQGKYTLRSMSRSTASRSSSMRSWPAEASRLRMPGGKPDCPRGAPPAGPWLR